MIQINRKGNREDNRKEPYLVCQNQVPYLRFHMLDQEKWLTHGFSTRLGGVSTGCFASMNLGFLKGEPYAVVAENYRRLGSTVGFDWERAVLSYQTHTTNIKQVIAEDAGKGTVRERDYTDIDGLITDQPGIALVTFYADCVPLYFADRKNHVIGLSHSGWRGTVNQMGKKTLQAMQEAYGTKPEDVIAVVGPSICGDCFEVGPEVVEQFSKAFSRDQMERICKAGEADRSYLNLWEANRMILEDSGVPRAQIAVTDICTRCNPELLYSHRIMGPQRGNLAAILMIKEQDD